MPPVSSYPEIPIFVVGLLACVLAGALARWVSFYNRIVDQEIASKRFHSIDGLRGYLALGVVFHHLGINYQFYQTGAWEITSSRFNTFLGHGSVALFFMITAFLFWGRVIAAKGRLDTLGFYLSRLRRMVPMYFVAAGLVVISALVLTDFRLQVTPKEFFRQVMAWSLFTLPGTPDINGLPNTYLINTVFWSLAYEWKFYLVLPFLTVFSGPFCRWGLAIFAAICIALFSTAGVEWFFLAGCLAAIFVNLRIARALASSKLWAIVSILFFVVALAWVPAVYSPLGAVVLLLPFIVLASGNSLFGLLTWRPARLLGLLSYSVYVTHNWILYMLFRLVSHFFEIRSMSFLFYWSVGMVAVLLTVVVAAITYRYIEFPFLKAPEGMTRDRSRDAAGV